MQAIQINEYGDNSVLKSVQIQDPKPTANQVLVKLKASSVNPVDYKIRSGFMAGMLKKEFPFTLGWEGAGIITEVGSDVSSFHAGDEVMVMPNFMEGGTYAEYVAVNESEVVPKPKALSFSEASTIPYSIGTAYISLIEDAQITQGQKILIHGAGGAVGQMAVQIAKNNGLYVIGTASGEKIKELQELGINQVIDYRTTDFSEELQNLDVILDLVGGETLAKSYALLNKGGTIISTTQPLEKSELSKHGVSGKMTFFSNNGDKFKHINKWLNEGLIKVKAPQIFKLSHAMEALSLVENRKAESKVVFEF
ncbi:NADP-dependent oxidoreductase [Fulvivirga maritima]|uniref:NADP-dependent oxidoreductase n=1 Tax=Fulvivirga maritima TaxID=2904247 RepID=UPI001F2DA627|nr:NADP-dependent oxidoreductase [Fulvivirga maritima]UII26755.1 NADP-dependent oxidoreductase [Fulvivirga maritima]